MTIYLESPSAVEALQWTGENFDECRAFVVASPYHEFGTVHHKILLITRLEPVPGAIGDSDRMQVRISNWIVKKPLGSIVVMLDEFFHRVYRQAGREECPNQRTAASPEGGE
jgi:hypothetical protein